jgi:hypothetical protein
MPKGKDAEGTLPVALYVCGVEGLEYIGVLGVEDGKAWLVLFLTLCSSWPRASIVEPTCIISMDPMDATRAPISKFKTKPRSAVHSQRCMYN